jgi:hypothetical protein
MSSKDNSINYIELPMDNNAETKIFSTSRYWNENLQIGVQIRSAFPAQKLLDILMGMLRYQALEFWLSYTHMISIKNSRA